MDNSLNLIRKTLYDYLFQKAGEKMISTVKSSNLPISIKKERIIFARSGKCAKLLTGPTVPIPGPTFPRQVATAPAAVRKSNPKIDNKIEPNTNIEI